MSAQIIPTLAAKGSNPITRLRWPLTVAFCTYFALLCVVLIKVIPIFATLFAGLNVPLPLPTNALIATCRWSLPLFYLVATAVAVLKQFVPLRGARRLLASLTLIFAGVLLPLLVVICMYLPLFVLNHKLQLR